MMNEKYCEKCKKDVPTVEEHWGPSVEGQVTLIKCFYCKNVLGSDRDRNNTITPRH